MVSPLRTKCNFVPFIIEEVEFNKFKNIINVDNELPKPRSGHRIIYSCNNLYSFGGYNPTLKASEYQDPSWLENNPLFRELWRFNLIDRTWLRMPSDNEMPVELASHAMICHLNSILIVYGGTSTPIGEASSNSTSACNLKTGTWKKLKTTGQTPVCMYGQAVYRHENKLYVIGGTTGYTYSLDVHVLDLETLNWTLLVPALTRNCFIPDTRYRHEIVEYEGKLYIFGGGTRMNSYPFETIPTFDIKERYWYLTTSQPDCKRGSYPKARKCHALVKYKDYVYIHGGTNDKTHFKDMWRIDLNTMAWEYIPTSTEKSVFFHSATVTEEGCIYMFGGIWGEPSTRTDKIFKIYVDVPSLMTMCWDAVQKCYPDIFKLDKNEMLKFGIPPTIVQLMS